MMPTEIVVVFCVLCWKYSRCHFYPPHWPYTAPSLAPGNTAGWDGRHIFLFQKTVTIFPLSFYFWEKESWASIEADLLCWPTGWLQCFNSSFSSLSSLYWSTHMILSGLDSLNQFFFFITCNTKDIELHVRMFWDGNSF